MGHDLDGNCYKLASFSWSLLIFFCQVQAQAKFKFRVNS